VADEIQTDGRTDIQTDMHLCHNYVSAASYADTL